MCLHASQQIQAPAAAHCCSHDANSTATSHWQQEFSHVLDKHARVLQLNPTAQLNNLSALFARIVLHSPSLVLL